MSKTCQHLQSTLRSHTAPVKPSGKGCAECLASGDTWVHLRLCLSCGHVGCCDSSRNKHATAHFHQTQHPVVKSFEPGESWAWCYVDELTLDHVPSFPAESPPVHYNVPYL